MDWLSPLVSGVGVVGQMITDAKNRELEREKETTRQIERAEDIEMSNTALERKVKDGANVGVNALTALGNATGAQTVTSTAQGMSSVQAGTPGAIQTLGTQIGSSIQNEKQNALAEKQAEFEKRRLDQADEELSLQRDKQYNENQRELERLQISRDELQAQLDRDSTNKKLQEKLNSLKERELYLNEQIEKREREVEQERLWREKLDKQTEWFDSVATKELDNLTQIVDDAQKTGLNSELSGEVTASLTDALTNLLGFGTTLTDGTDSQRESGAKGNKNQSGVSATLKTGISTENVKQLARRFIYQSESYKQFRKNYMEISSLLHSGNYAIDRFQNGRVYLVSRNGKETLSRTLF